MFLFTHCTFALKALKRNKSSFKCIKIGSCFCLAWHCGPQFGSMVPEWMNTMKGAVMVTRSRAILDPQTKAPFFLRDRVQISMSKKKGNSLQRGARGLNPCSYPGRHSMFLEFPFRGEGGLGKMVNDFLFLDIELCTRSLTDHEICQRLPYLRMYCIDP